MDYSQYTANPGTVKEYMFETSDGVSLKIIDFCGKNIPEERPVIIFVAGWISMISGWTGVLKVLTGSYRVYYLESREKQSSVVPDVKKVSFSMKRLHKDLAEFIKKNVPSQVKFILAGSSLGASAILEYCSSDKRLPLSAVLVGPNAEIKFPRLLEIIVPFIHPSLYFLIKPVIKWYLRNFRLDKKNSREQVEKYEITLDCADPYKLKANALALRKYSLWDRVKNINVPCLIIGATTDTLHGTENIKRLIEIMPYSSYMEFESNRDTHSEKAGHAIIEYIERY